MGKRNRRVEAEGILPRHHELGRHAPAGRRRAAAAAAAAAAAVGRGARVPDAASERALEREGLAAEQGAVELEAREQEALPPLEAGARLAAVGLKPEVPAGV